VIRRRSGERRPRVQRGFAMLALLSLILLLGAYFIANALTQTSSDLVNTREQRNMTALLQAKAALVAYAASTEGWQTYKGQTTNQPGGLPCPDRDNPPDGTANPAGCSAAANRVGRLPWSTIGSDDLRDASGEQIWYAVSSNYYKNIGTNDVNSDTQGLLTVTGTAPASNVVAIVFAPGPAIQDSTAPGTIQNRSGANAIRIASYLEGVTQAGNDYTFSTNALPSDTFNDRVLTITQADLMTAVEPAVAARIERDIKPYLQTYYSQWNAYPFPATFANPNPGTTGPSSTRLQSAYAGDPSQTSGLLPLTASLAYPWTPGSGAVGLISGTATVSAGSCNTVSSSGDTPSTGSGWQCTFTISPAVTVTSRPSRFGGTRYTATATIADPTILVQGGVSNVGISFAVLPSASAVGNKILPSSSPTPSTIGALTSTGAGTVKYQATYSSLNCSGTARATGFVPSVPGCSTTYSLRVTVPDVTVSSLTSTADAAAGWFIANEWFRQTYYAVAPSCLPGGGGNCSTALNPCTFQCLTVKNMPSYYASPNNNKFAILVLAGRVLPGINSTTRPSSNLADYFEGENSTPGDFIFEHRAGTPTSINDRVVVIAP
jgi:hypothetical protein